MNSIFSTVSPSDGHELSPVEMTDPEAVVAHIAKARTSQRQWAALPLNERARRLLELGRQMLANREEILDILVAESGRSRPECLMTEIAGVVEFIKSAIKTSKKALKPEKISLSKINYPGKRAVIEAVPRGVVGIIGPWNYPLSIFYKPLFPALLAGNAVVLKPSEFTPRTGAWLAKICCQVLLDDLVQVVQGGGEIGAALVSGGVDAIVFTGSVRTGRKVALAAAEQLIPSSIELGGKDAAIVLADCNLDRTVAGIAQWSIHNCGQNCAGIERLYIEEEIADTFISKLAIVFDALRATSGSDSDFGPLVASSQLKLVQAHIADALEKGATLRSGGEATGEGNFFRPTLLDHCNDTMRVVREETFGPVLAVIRVKTVDEAIDGANDCDYGLNGSIWSADLKNAERLARRLNVGIALVNNHSITGIMPELPWTGTKNTGTGVASSRHSYPTFTRRRTIFIDKNKKPDPFWFPYNPDLKQMGELITAYSLGSITAGLKLGGLLGKRIKAIGNLVNGNQNKK